LEWPDMGTSIDVKMPAQTFAPCRLGIPILAPPL
jgi:hypothetical protein